MLNPIPPLRQRFIFVISVLLAAVGLLLPWWRHHGFLRDFYDYGNVIAAAGRIQLGDKPYVDFLTPIQTLQFYQAVLAERLFGPRYLSLTYINAIFIVASLLAFTALLFRPLGRWPALLIATAVVAGSSMQHTILWYNSLGVAWVAVVVWAMAQRPRRTAPRVMIWTLVFGVLWLGGMTKLTFQTAALAFALLFTLRSASRREISWRTAAGLGVAWVFAGVVLPVATEMALTGATFVQWKHNVLELASSRTDLLRQIGTWSFYWITPHDYYEPIYLPFVGGWGMVLLAITALFAWRSVHRNAPRKTRSSEPLFFGIIVFGAAACGVVFLAAHYEIAYMSAAAWLVFATGVVVAFVPRERSGAGRWARGVLVVGAISLIGTAWASAWAGARVLWGIGPTDHSGLISADTLPARFAYLKGVAIRPTLHESLQRFDAYYDVLAANGLPPNRYYFVNGTEWMVRAVPEARHHGLPLWLQPGTTFSNDNVRVITDKLGIGSDIQVVVSDDPWNVWYYGMDSFLKEHYRADRIGPQLHVFRVRANFNLEAPLERPLDFTTTTKSNLLSNEMVLTGGPVVLRIRPDGGFISGTQSYHIGYGIGIPDISGDMVAERLPNAAEGSIEVVFRVRERQPGLPDRILSEQRVTVTAKQPVQVRSFDATAQGGELVFEVELPPGEGALAGWRNLRTRRSAAVEKINPAPLNRKLLTQRPNEAWQHALFADEHPAVSDLAGFSIDVHADRRGNDPELFVHAPGEVWFKLTGPAVHVSGKFGFRELAWTKPDGLLGVRAAVVFYKGGRFEILDQRELRPRREADRAQQSFDVVAPETEGWIGLVITTLDDTNAYGHFGWRDVRVR